MDYDMTEAVEMATKCLIEAINARDVHHIRANIAICEAIFSDGLAIAVGREVLRAIKGASRVDRAIARESKKKHVF